VDWVKGCTKLVVGDSFGWQAKETLVGLCVCRLESVDINPQNAQD